MRGRLSSLAAIVLLALAACSVAPRSASTVPPTSRATPNAHYIESFELVWQTIEEAYFDPTFGGLDWERIGDRYRPRIAAAADDKAFHSVLNAMLFELDVSHAVVLPPEGQGGTGSMSLAAAGTVGLDLRLVDGRALITSVGDGSPAAQAGLRPGYVLQRIDGATVDNILVKGEEQLTPPTTEWNRQASLSMTLLGRLYGAPGTAITLTYQDGGGDSREVKLTRMQRPGRSGPLAEGLPADFLEFESRQLKGSITYIRFNSFHPDLLEQVLSAIADSRQAEGLIIDLRGNPGGAFPVRKAIAEKLLLQPALLWQYQRKDGTEQVFLDPAEDSYTGPLVVLVDGLSGSSSEEFAGGLQAIGRAAIVGQRTAGRVLIADVKQLPTGATFVYPVGRTLLADGTELERRGVIPDVVVQHDRGSLLRGVDAQLVAAIQRVERLALSETEPSDGPVLALLGRLVDGSGGEPQREGVLIVRGAWIEAAGQRDEISIPPDAQVIDLEGATLLPGFINTHVHNAYRTGLLKIWAQDGVTTVRDVGERYPNSYFTKRDQFNRDPVHAFIVAAGPLVTVPRGYPIAGNDFPSLTVTSPDDAREKIDQLIDEGADVIKITLTEGRSPTLSPAEAAAIVHTAHRRGVPVTVHATSAATLRLALDAGVDDIGHMATDRVDGAELQRMVDLSVAWVPTLDALGGRDRNNLKRFLSLGGRVAMGNDGGYLTDLELGMPLQELEWMRKAGMTPMQIIVASTSDAAAICGLGQMLGTLESGKLADVLVVRGDPLRDLSALGEVQMVLHRGVIIRDEVGS